MKDKLEARIKELDAQISELSAERSTAKQQLAEIATNLKVGDRVTYEGAKCVWELTAIRPGYGKEPKFFGAKIKKDGTPGLLVSQILQAPYGKTLVKSNALGQEPCAAVCARSPAPTGYVSEY